jgi:hypothetical protein
MGQTLLRLQADMLACYARIEAMKAQNATLACVGDPPTVWIQ